MQEVVYRVDEGSSEAANLWAGCSAAGGVEIGHARLELLARARENYESERTVQDDGWSRSY